MGALDAVRLVRPRQLSLLVLVAFCFLTFAAFTPLHQHAVDGSCSLNHFDDITIVPALFLQYSFVQTGYAWHHCPDLLQPVPYHQVSQAYLRGPPVC